jgi:hypothetical protein
MLPPSWKRDKAEQPVCDKCWRAAYVLRAVTVPVAEPVDATKDELWAALRRCWQASTAAANLAVQALLKADVVRLPGMTKMPPMPRVYLYGEVPPGICGMDCNSHVALLHAVEQKYRKARFDVVWLRSAAPPSYRYPVPYPLRPTNWRCKTGEGGEPLVECRFGGRWWTLRLRGGWQFKRLLAAHGKIVAGDAIGTEMSLLQGGEGGKRLLAKLVAWFPRAEQREKEGTLRVTTGGGRFLCATIGGREPWILNADHVRRWIAEHEEFRQRMAEDLKHEKRWPRATREQMLRVLDSRCKRQHCRLKDFVGHASKMLVQFAARQRAALIWIDDCDKSYFPSFPWRQFREAVIYKADELGITVDFAECSSAEQTNGTAREEPNTGDANE